MRSACGSTAGRSSAPPRSCSRPAARRRCGRGRRTRPARPARGCCSPTAPARRSPTSRCSSSTRPPSRRPNGADGFLVTEAIRGEGARLLDHLGERFVDELAPRDEVARAIQRRMLETDAAVGRPRHARRRPGAVPERRHRAAARRHRPRARAGAGRAGRALHDGRNRDRPRRPRDRSRACTRSASARAPACTAPTGSPRTRSPNASCSAAGRPMRRSASPRRPRARPDRSRGLRSRMRPTGPRRR